MFKKMAIVGVLSVIFYQNTFVMILTPRIDVLARSPLGDLAKRHPKAATCAEIAVLGIIATQVIQRWPADRATKARFAAAASLTTTYSAGLAIGSTQKLVSDYMWNSLVTYIRTKRCKLPDDKMNCMLFAKALGTTVIDLGTYAFISYCANRNAGIRSVNIKGIPSKKTPQHTAFEIGFKTAVATVVANLAYNQGAAIIKDIKSVWREAVQQHTC